MKWIYNHSCFTSLTTHKLETLKPRKALLINPANTVFFPMSFLWNFPLNVLRILVYTCENNYLKRMTYILFKTFHILPLCLGYPSVTPIYWVFTLFWGIGLRRERNFLSLCQGSWKGKANVLLSLPVCQPLLPQSLLNERQITWHPHIEPTVDWVNCKHLTPSEWIRFYLPSILN